MVKNKKKLKKATGVLVYVSIVACGEWSTNTTRTAYAGRNLSRAKEAIQKYKYPNPVNNFGWVEHWVDGKNTHDEQVYPFKQ